MKDNNVAVPILVAVYGTLRNGFYNHRLLDNNQSKFLGEMTSEPQYTMYHLGGYPAVCEGGSTPLALEIYSVSPEVKRNLDRLEGFYGKGNDNNLYDTTTINTPYGKATMYVMINRQMSGYKMITSGDWKNITIGAKV